MARAPKDYAAERRKLDEKMQAMLAKQAEKEARLQEANRRQIVRFVESAKGSELDPYVLMGLILDGIEKAKNPIMAGNFRRKGEEYLAPKPRAPRADKSGGGEPQGGDQGHAEPQAA